WRRQEADMQPTVLNCKLTNNFCYFGLLRRAIFADDNLPISWRLTGDALEQFRQFSRTVERQNTDGKSFRHFLICGAGDRLGGGCTPLVFRREWPPPPLHRAP